MDADFEVVTVERPLLLSGRAAARWLGLDAATFRALALENDLQPVSTGKRLFWKRAELARLAGLVPGGESA